MADYKMATEQYAYSIGVGQGSPTNNLMATKSRAEALGCRIRNNTYVNNLLVRLVDLWSCSCLGSTCNCHGNGGNCTCNSCNTDSSYTTSCTCNSCDTDSSYVSCNGFGTMPCSCNTQSGYYGNCNCNSNTSPTSRSCDCQTGISKYCGGHYTDSYDTYCSGKSMCGGITCSATASYEYGPYNNKIEYVWGPDNWTSGRCNVSRYRRSYSNSASCGSNTCSSKGACNSVACTCNSCNTDTSCSKWVSCSSNCSGHKSSATCGSKITYGTCNCNSNTPTVSHTCPCHSNSPGTCSGNTTCSLKGFKEGTNT